MQFTISAAEESDAGLTVRGQFVAHLSVIVPADGPAHVKPDASGMQDDELSGAIAAAVANAVSQADPRRLTELERQVVHVDPPVRAVPVVELPPAPVSEDVRARADLPAEPVIVAEVVSEQSAPVPAQVTETPPSEPETPAPVAPATPPKAKAAVPAVAA